MTPDEFRRLGHELIEWVARYRESVAERPVLSPAAEPAGAERFALVGHAGELAILFCFVFLYFAAAGPGPWSIDAARRK